MLNAEVSQQGDAVTVHLAGRLVGESACMLGKIVADQVQATGVDVVLDLEAVEQIDDEGLREVLLALKRARRAGGNLTLAQAQDTVRDALRASRLDEIIVVRDSLEGAFGRS